MKKIILLLGFILFSVSAYAIEQTIVGTLSGSVATLSVNEQTLIEAFQDELDDGSVFYSVEIVQDDNNQWYLKAIGENSDGTMRFAYCKLDLTVSNTFFIDTQGVQGDLSGCDLCSAIVIGTCGYAPECGCYEREGSGWKYVGTCDGFARSAANGAGYLGDFY